MSQEGKKNPIQWGAPLEKDRKRVPNDSLRNVGLCRLMNCIREEGGLGADCDVSLMHLLYIWSYIWKQPKDLLVRITSLILDETEPYIVGSVL